MNAITLTLLILFTGLLIAGAWLVAQLPNKRVWLERMELVPRHRTVTNNIAVAAWTFFIAMIALVYYILLA